MDLWEYRNAAYEVILSVDKDYQEKFRLIATGMDTKTPSGDLKDAVAASIGYVDEAQWIVLIVAWNYGFIAGGCGVTETEYRHAIEQCKPPKPVFVYLAGEKNDQPPSKQYLYKAPEKVNLADWKDRTLTNDEQYTKLTAFKQELRVKEFKLFAGLDDFKESLRETLLHRIDRE